MTYCRRVREFFKNKPWIGKLVKANPESEIVTKTNEAFERGYALVCVDDKGFFWFRRKNWLEIILNL